MQRSPVPGASVAQYLAPPRPAALCCRPGLGVMEPPCDCPHRFYMGNPDLAALADCFAVVGGVRLPLHSQVLSQQSGVLRELFLAQSEGGVACEVRQAPGVGETPWL